MVNDLVNIENIQTDFCIYEIEYETREYDYKYGGMGGRKILSKPGRPKWNKQQSFYNLGGQYKNILKTEYRYAIDRQMEVSRRYGLDYNNMLRLLNNLSTQKLIPLSLQQRKSIVMKSKGRRVQVKKRMTKDYVRSFKSVQLYRYTFRSQIVSFLIQKRTDILEKIGSDSENYDKMILVFRDMNTDTKNCITFNQAVDNLYNKIIGEFK